MNTISHQQIQATEFFREWVSATNQKKSVLLEFWMNQKEFTKLILGDANPEAITKVVGKALGFEVYSRDYYSIDTTFYRHEDRTPNVKDGQTWFRNITIAFEHENFFNKKLYEEVSHLLIINCELRVLVTYPYGNTDAIMKHLHDIIKGSKIADHLSDNANFLIICGKREPFEWNGLVYHNDNWMDITCIK
jgi:hypothetical protein